MSTRDKVGRYAYWGNWGVSIYDGPRNVASLVYPVGNYGPIEGDAPTRQARKDAVQHWKDHGEIVVPFKTEG